VVSCLVIPPVRAALCMIITISNLADRLER